MSSKFANFAEALLCVAASSSGKTFVVGGAREAAEVATSAIHAFAVAKVRPGPSLPAPGPVHAACFLADDLLVVGTADGRLLGFDLEGEAPTPRFDVAAHAGPINALAADAMGKLVVSAGEDGRICAFTLEVAAGTPSLKPAGDRKLSVRPLRTVCLSESVVAAAGDDSVVRAVATKSLGSAAIREMSVGDDGVGAICFSDDGRLIVGCADGSIRLCYLEGEVDEENRSRDEGHTGPVRGLLLTPELLDDDGRTLPRRLLSIGADGALKSWPLGSRRKPKTHELAQVPLLGMAWAPASSRAKPERRGGTVVVIDDRRRIHVLTLAQTAEIDDDTVKIESIFARLREDLGARSAKVREAAVNQLGPLPEDDARRALDKALGDDRVPEIRKLAADVIGETLRRRSRPALRKALGDDQKPVRTAALAALTRIEQDSPLGPVRAALRSRHPDIRIAAIGRLPALRSASPLVPGLVADQLGDKDGHARIAALDALYKLDEGDPAAPCRTALARGPADVRAEVLTRIGFAGHAATPWGRDLLERALDDEDSDVRRTAFLVALGTRKSLAAALRGVDPLVKQGLDKIEKDRPLQTDQSRGAVGEEDRAPLFAALACRHPDTALRGARGLALLRDGRATGALLQLSREPDPGVRRAVVAALLVSALVMPGDTRPLDRLRWLVDDADASVRAAAMSGLETLSEPEGDRGAVEVAATALRCGHEDVRVRALQILVKFGGDARKRGTQSVADRADELLGQALHDEAAKVRAEAFRTLWAWHSSDPRIPLQRGAQSRHADIREKVVAELARVKDQWVEAPLLELVADTAASVGLAAYEALTRSKIDKRAKAWRTRTDVHLAALGSSRPEVRAAGCRGAIHGEASELRKRLIELIEDEYPDVHLAAIDAIDRLLPDDQQAFVLAFGSKFWGLRVRAAELCGRRRDKRAVEPMESLLRIPLGDRDRPPDDIRQRGARALADVGDPATIPYYLTLLDDDDPLVREGGSRGLAGAVRPGLENRLVPALSHPDLAVRSWVAEGLARMGDARAVPVLAGTLKHDHRPIRLGAILSFVALGPDGTRGILQGLEDRDREIQDLVFAVVVARDVALAQRDLPPDLLLSALSSAHPEIRFAAARTLEQRSAGEDISPVAQELVGPRRPERAADMKNWPPTEQRPALLGVLVATLASDDPAQRYAAARVLSLRPKPEAFWRETKRLQGPASSDRPDAPHTTYETEAPQPRKKGWLRRLVDRGGEPAQADTFTGRVLRVLTFVGGPSPRTVPPADAPFGKNDVDRLVFGTYAGLVRQAPAAGQADETHRIRRDAIGRLGELCSHEAIGRASVLPILGRSLSDPHHLVRRAAMATLRTLYPSGATEPAALALRADAADIGRAAIDELVTAGAAGDPVARDLALSSVDAPNREVRSYAVGRIDRLFEAGSLEPWLVALRSEHADVRLSVVDRLVDSQDERVDTALSKALESDHEDLRLRAAEALARRGDARTTDVLAGFLRLEDRGRVRRAVAALVSLAHARPQDSGHAVARAAAARTVGARLLDDPDATADRSQLIGALSRIGDPAGAPALLELTGDKDGAVRQKALTALWTIARDPTASPKEVRPGGPKRIVYRESLALEYAQPTTTHADEAIRTSTIAVLRDIDDPGAEALLSRLVQAREPEVRVAACEALAFRAEHVEAASVDTLSATLRAGRRELVLPAAAGLAARHRPEAFQALVLVLRAGEHAERERAAVSMGSLGDVRALDELEPFVDPKAELEPEDQAMIPAVAEALGRLLPHLKGTENAEAATRIRETVQRLSRDSQAAIRKRALTGMRHAGDEHSRTQLQRAAGDALEEADVRVHAIAELGRLGDPAAEASLADTLADPRAAVRRAALAALQQIFPDDRTRTSLLALGSRHADVSGPAAAFLAKRGEPALLVSKLSEIDDANVRRRLRRGLVRRGAHPAAELSALLGSDDPATAAEAAWIAGAAKDPGAGKAALAAIDRSRAQWTQLRKTAPSARERARSPRAAAIREAWRASLWAARRIDADAAIAARAALDDEAPDEVRCEAVRVLAGRGDASDLSRLEPLLFASDLALRTAAAEAVATVAPDRCAQLVEGRSTADPIALRAVISRALASKGGALLGDDVDRRITLPTTLASAAATELTAVAKNGAPEPARLTAIASLGRLSGDEAETALQSLVGDKSQTDTVRGAAYRALRRLQRAAARRKQAQQSGPTTG